MADLTAEQLRWLRDEIGDAPSDTDLNQRFADYESVRDVALSVLRDRRQELLATPLSVNVTGVASTNAAENVKAIERQIAALARLDEDPSDDSPADGVAGADSMEVYNLTRSRGR